MTYLSTAQIAEQWNVSRRLVSKYCEEKRIEGAMLVGKRWMVPDSAKKPIDMRTKKSKQLVEAVKL